MYVCIHTQLDDIYIIQIISRLQRPSSLEMTEMICIEKEKVFYTIM